MRCSAAAPAGAVGGYGNTNEGKIIAAAFMDNYNNIVDVVRGDPSLQRNVGTLKQEAAAGGADEGRRCVRTRATSLLPKIANVKVLAQPADDAKVLATLSKGDELVVVGKASNGYISVQSASVTGWVKVVLVTRP